jgi:hypothetical protein
MRLYYIKANQIKNSRNNYTELDKLYDTDFILFGFSYIRFFAATVILLPGDRPAE